MLAGLEVPPAAQAERVITSVLPDRGHHRRVQVDSPPGAGKSRLVVRPAIELATAAEPLIIGSQTNQQVDDLIDRLAQMAPEPCVGRFSGTESQPWDRVNVRGKAGVAAKAADLGGTAILIGAAAKWATVTLYAVGSPTRVWSLHG
ncbi:hypothetical protein FHX75_1244 [Micromonospora palomenae]|uniref:AAA domain-containing protein n=1 Tax=Micromonospora palomenae TaxID=1461247 RepID=A0A561WCD5_9ACTN|nr:hypothetical protein [Micromonospora palomenae]TWG21531.1 hypothetical protein FHX75_1244 [Micromonospora palomenae]